MKMETSKTKDVMQVINNLKLFGKKVTVLVKDFDENLFLGSRNIKNLNVIPAESASTYDMLDCQTLVLDVAGAETLNNQLAN